MSIELFVQFVKDFVTVIHKLSDSKEVETKLHGLQTCAASTAQQMMACHGIHNNIVCGHGNNFH